MKPFSSSIRLGAIGSPSSSLDSEVRLRLLFLPTHSHIPVLSLVGRHVDIHFIAAQLPPHQSGWVDVILRGSPEAIQATVTILQQAEVDMIWKSPTDGDSWHC